MIAFQLPSGTGALSPKFSVTSCGLTRGFHRPLIGCCPRPMNNPGGSTSQFAISTSISSDYSLPINCLESFALGLFCLGDTFLFLFWKGLVSLLFLFFHLSFFICKLVSHRKVYVLYHDVVITL